MLAAMVGCVDSGGGPAGPLPSAGCPEESLLTYENFGRPFLLDWCNGCHSSVVPEERRQDAPLDVSFDDLAMVRAHLQDIDGEVRAETMPPAGGPGPEERALLEEWVACGAPSDYDTFGAEE